MRWRDCLRLFRAGGPGLCQIAVTNACNARCRFCSFPRVKAAEVVMADPARLLQGLAALSRRGPYFVTFTGGEPLLYPPLLPVLARARDLGLKTILVTNAARLTPELLTGLSRAGLGRLIISLDAPSSAAHDAHRGLPGLTAHIREMVPWAKKAGLNPVASVTLSRLIGDLEALLRFVRALGFESLTFSYPLTELRSPYLGYAAHDLVNYTSQELDALFGRLLALPARKPPAVLNSRQGMLDLRRRLHRRPRRFPCLAGYKHFFVDWHLRVYRCHMLSDILGPLEEIDRVALIRDGCDACISECYRDASVFQYAAVSFRDFLEAWRRGNWLRGLGRLLHPYNFLSLRDLLNGRRWIRP